MSITALDVLTEMERRGIRVAAEGENLSVDAPKGAVDAALRDQIVAHKAGLLALLREPDAPFPLTAGQQALWYQHTLDAGGYAYTIGFAAHLSDPIDLGILDRALCALVERHSQLRTRVFADGDTPLQEIMPPPARVLTVHDGPLSRQDREDAALAAYKTPLALDVPVQLRAQVWPGDGEVTLLLTLPHIAIDGQSLWALLDAIPTVYQRIAAGEPPFDSPAPAPYARHVQEQNAAPHDTAWAYWQKALADLPDPMDFPFDLPRPKRQRFDGGAVQDTLPEALVEDIRACARRHGVTPYVVLLSVFHIVLHKQAQAQDILIGSPFSGRTRAAFDATLGYFVNPLPVRARITPETSCADLFAEVAQAARDALDHQDMPLPDMITRLGLPRDPSRPPLFQTSFAFQSAGAATPLARGMMRGTQGQAIDWKGFSAAIIPLPQQEGLFDLTLEVLQDDARYDIALKYNASLLSSSTASSLLSQFIEGLRGVVGGVGCV
ncbi:hypothetical protein FHS89_000987, partial [Rubricella aquisinus]